MRSSGGTDPLRFAGGCGRLEASLRSAVRALPFFIIRNRFGFIPIPTKRKPGVPLCGTPLPAGLRSESKAQGAESAWAPKAGGKSARSAHTERERNTETCDTSHTPRQQVHTPPELRPVTVTSCFTAVIGNEPRRPAGGAENPKRPIKAPTTRDRVRPCALYPTRKKDSDTNAREAVAYTPIRPLFVCVVNLVRKNECKCRRRTTAGGLLRYAVRVSGLSGPPIRKLSRHGSINRVPEEL